MSNEPKVHPKVYESHLKVLAWNDYVIAHLGLRLEKQNYHDYRALNLFQGNYLLLHVGSAKISATLNAQLHRNLKTFLENYIEHLRKLPGLPPEFNFEPPDVNRF